jgi:ACS family allantoate permease-like MFS transporter
MLHFENKRREAEKRDDSYDDVYVTQELADGTKTEKRVDRVRCDFSTIPLFSCVLPGIP